MKTQHIHEKTLLESCLAGKREARRMLYERYRVQMFRVCMRYAPSREVAEDLLQEGFYQVFKDLRQFRGDGPLGAWINRIMVRICLTYLKKQRKHKFQEPHAESFTDLHDGEAAILGEFEASHIMQIIQSLPPGYRAVFNLYAIEGYSHKEIGQQLNIAESSSRSQYMRARHLLQQLLTKRNTSSI